VFNTTAYHNSTKRDSACDCWIRTLKTPGLALLGEFTRNKIGRTETHTRTHSCPSYVRNMFSRKHCSKFLDYFAWTKHNNRHTKKIIKNNSNNYNRVEVHDKVFRASRHQLLSSFDFLLLEEAAAPRERFALASRAC
jgi:hypothetical protein